VSSGSTSAPTSASSSHTQIPTVVLGPTGSGKSDVAMAAALADGQTDIVVVDSMQVYRGMDVGTAKPTSDDRVAVPHHCLDIVGPEIDFTVAEFAARARVALNGVAAAGRRSLLVAGTGLYLRSITDPMELPGQWPQVRDDLEARAQSEGSVVLHRELVVLDPLAASKMDPANARRVVRALEVTVGSGRPFSSFGNGVDVYPAVPFRQIGVQWQRPVLAARIEARVHSMMAHGLLDEVAGLAARPQQWSRTARQALGYKELLAHLDGSVGLDEAVAATILRTRQFAVRQERWFRRDPRIRWVLIHEDPVAELLPVLQQV
jgi:tRNA dimethylallyltransferase